MVTIQVGSCALTGIGIHNGQGLGTYDVDSKESGKKTSEQVVGSEWLTSISIPNNSVAQLVEHRPFKARVVGSNPTGITNGGCSSVGKSTCLWHKGSGVQFSSITQQRDVVQLGRTLALGARGRWFKSSHLD